MRRNCYSDATRRPALHRDPSLRRQARAVRDAFAQVPRVVAATIVQQPPGRGADTDSYVAQVERQKPNTENTEGTESTEGREGGEGRGEGDRPDGARLEEHKIYFNAVTEGFLETFEIGQVAGEDYDAVLRQ